MRVARGAQPGVQRQYVQGKGFFQVAVECFGVGFLRLGAQVWDVRLRVAGKQPGSAGLVEVRQCFQINAQA